MGAFRVEDYVDFVERRFGIEPPPSSGVHAIRRHQIDKTRELIVGSLVADCIRLLDAAEETPRVLALRAKAQSYVQVMKFWSSVAPTSTRIERLLSLAMELRYEARAVTRRR